MVRQAQFKFAAFLGRPMPRRLPVGKHRPPAGRCFPGPAAVGGRSVVETGPIARASAPSLAHPSVPALAHWVCCQAGRRALDSMAPRTNVASWVGRSQVYHWLIIQLPEVIVALIDDGAVPRRHRRRCGAERRAPSE